MSFSQTKPLSSVVIDEIGLEGLEGITISGLWIRLSDVMTLPLPLLERFQNLVWNLILQAHDYLYFYELPEPREKLKLWNRFSVLDPDYGLPVSFTECPFNLYKFNPITDGEVVGSCEHYESRIPIPFDVIKTMTLKEIDTKWGEKFVIVGNQKLRYSCLIPPHISTPTELTCIQYCVLEFIGRSRRNGMTTAGKYSILHCCKESAIGFYIKNKLARLGLIVRQTYTEKRLDRLVGSSLLHLTRFYVPNKTAFTAVIEKMFTALKHTPNQRLSMSSLRALFPSENLSMIKKIQATHFFKKFFDISTLPAKELADFKPTAKLGGEREVICVKLKNPNISEDELFNDDELTEEKETNEFYDYKHAFIDMPITEEIFRAVEKYGSEGCSQSQLCANLSANNLNIRQALKKAIQSKIITTYCKDMGRQRTNMLVAITCANSLNKSKEDREIITNNLKCRDEPKLPPEPDIPTKDIEQITASIKEVVNKFKPTIRDPTTKQLDRQQKIVNLVDELCIIQISWLRAEILKYEQEAGYKDEICNKSIYRIIARLQKDNIVNMYEISLRFNENARIYRYITHPKIDINHHVIKQEILRLKNALFLFLEGRKCRAVTLKASATANPTTDTRVGLIPRGAQKSPKFLTARFMHEFMFYLFNDLPSTREPLSLTENLLSTWLQSEPNIDCAELYQNMLEEHIYPYRENINWKTFITPLPVYKDKPAGWISFPDVLERIPFSLLNKIISVPSTVDKLAIDYLVHPIRQHYIIKQLPLALQSLINRNRLSRIMSNIVQVLLLMGLIQVSEKQARDPMQIWVYMNRKATVVDTTPSEPGYIKITDNREYSKILFNFKKMSDIKQYWNSLHRICLVTKLGFIHKNQEPDSKGVYRQRKLALNEIVSPVVNLEEAKMLDTGIPPGDGLGAGGLASGMYSSFKRNWTWLVNNKHTAAATAKLRKTGTKYMRTRMSKLADEIMPRKQQSVVAIKKVTCRLATTTSTGKVVKRTKIVSLKTKSKFPTDQIDRDAIRQMRSLRARWSHKEDLILKMARATFLFLGVPILHFNLRDVAKISRDIIRQQCFIHNKTTQTCHRRIHFMVKTNRHLPELPQWLHSMQTNDHLTSRYNSETFHRELRELYPVKEDFQNALAIHFLYVFSVLQAQCGQDEPQSKSNMKSKFPNTLTEFYQKFRECTPLIDDKALLYTNPTTTIDLQLATINNVLHSSLCCVRDKTQYNLQIFDVFKTYSEEALHTAFKIARIDGLVVCRKKSQNQTFTTQLTGPSFVFSNKYRMSLMFLKLPYIVLDMLHAFFTETTKQIFNDERSAVEIKSPHSGQFFFIAELLWNEVIEIDIKTPSNTLTIDPLAQQSTTSQTQKIMDHFYNHMENAPQTEYSKHFDALGELAKRVKFKAANVKHKMTYNPFDVIAKMDEIQIHFFCFLGNLNRSVDIDFGKLVAERLASINQGDEQSFPSICPFYNVDCSMKNKGFGECVMKSEDYLQAIETIVKTRQNVLNEINEDCDLNVVDAKNNSFLIYTDNILSIYETYRSFMKTQLAKEDARDFGSIVLPRQPLDLIGICKSIVETRDEVSVNDEHEPELNKDEKVARASDVFVVNLPTLRIRASRESEKMQKVQHKGVMLPEVIMESALLRDAVLEKIVEDACWKYTQNDLGSLRTLMTELRITEEEQDEVVRIYDFIKPHELGVAATDLGKRFPDLDFLKKAIKLLRQHYLVLRAGVSTFVYVQKNHVRHWVIHTRHIKRLDRESMGKLVPDGRQRPVAGQKRRAEDDVSVENEPSSSKQSRTNEEGRRKPRPIERYEDIKEVTTTSFDRVSKEQLLILKPCPWIRVNGSLNRRVLDKWLGSIFIECSAMNSCTVNSLCLRYKQMHAADIMYLLEILTELKIIELRYYKQRSVGLFTKYKALEQGEGNEFTDPQNTYIITMPDGMLRMALFIGDKQYRTEFV